MIVRCQLSVVSGRKRLANGLDLIPQLTTDNGLIHDPH